MLLGDLVEGSKLSDASVGENDVDSPLGRDCLVETIEVGQLGDVSLHASNVAANHPHGHVEFLLTTACYEYVSPFLDEKFGCGQPNSSGATGNDRHFSLQLLNFGHRWFFSIPAPDFDADLCKTRSIPT